MKREPEKKWLAPTEGKRLRKPFTEGGFMLTPEGELITMSTYWRRRIKFGDVEVLEGPKKKKTTSPKAPKPQPKPAEEAAPKPAEEAAPKATRK